MVLVNAAGPQRSLSGNAIQEMRAPHDGGALSVSWQLEAHGRLQLGFGFDAASAAMSLNASRLVDLAM
jgi:hypothetical protein